MATKTIHALENIALDNSDIRVFLAGESNQDWQSEFIKMWDRHLANSFQKTISFINPYKRNITYNSNEEVYKDSKFYQHVKWELSAAEHADYILINLTEGSMSASDLLCLGTYIKSSKLLVICNDFFWKKGNIDILCEHYNLKQFSKFEDVISFLLSKVRS